ncbi:MAG: hypothetical protein VYE22_31055 [Myxococcota bacterium]|nr:hypothetical protein [Myxococcota bacterium]
MSRSFPIDVWGRVTADARPTHVMVTRAGSSGYLLLQREDGGTFDIWLETEEEVAEALAELAPRWESRDVGKA